jgi:SAM-dependent methyltransferase
VASQRLRALVGTVGLWMEDSQAAEPSTYPHWQEIAEETQRFKTLLMRLEKADSLDVDATTERLAEQLRHFCLFMQRRAGDESAEAIDSREELGARIQREILPYLLKSRIVERLFTKPRGYADDYLTNEFRYRGEPDGKGRSGALIDQCLLREQPIAIGRQRCDFISQRIQALRGDRDAPFRVSAVFSGTAPELFAAGNGRTSEFTLHATFIDFDRRALAEVERTHGTRSGRTAFRLIDTNLLDVAAGRLPSDIPPQDLVYSASLLDYFDDRLAVKVLNYIHRLLKREGTVVLFSFHAGNPFKAFMDYVLEWKVIHRTEADVTALFEASEFHRPCACRHIGNEGVAFAAECQKS